jgi:hypothetical protein
MNKIKIFWIITFLKVFGIKLIKELKVNSTHLNYRKITFNIVKDKLII